METDEDEAYMRELEEVWQYAQSPFATVEDVPTRPLPKHSETLMEQRMREAGLIR